MTTITISPPSNGVHTAVTKRHRPHAAEWIRGALFGALLSLAALPAHAQKWVKLEEGLQYDV